MEHVHAETFVIIFLLFCFFMANRSELKARKGYEEQIERLMKERNWSRKTADALNLECSCLNTELSKAKKELAEMVYKENDKRRLAAFN